jgi:hypothetical protein
MNKKKDFTEMVSKMKFIAFLISIFYEGIMKQ